MRRWALLAAGFILLLVAGCGGSGNESPAEQAGDLREAHAQIEGELLLNEVEEGAAEYAAAEEHRDRAGENKALREVQRAAYGCWEFGIEECSEILKVESAVRNLEEEAHRKIPFTHPPAGSQPVPISEARASKLVQNGNDGAPSRCVRSVRSNRQFGCEVSTDGSIWLDRIVITVSESGETYFIDSCRREHGEHGGNPLPCHELN